MGYRKSYNITAPAGSAGRTPLSNQGPRPAMLRAMYLKILAHPVFVNLNFHMPMVVDLSHPLIMLQGENGSGKSTLLHSIYYALRGEQVEALVYRLEGSDTTPKSVFLF